MPFDLTDLDGIAASKVPKVHEIGILVVDDVQDNRDLLFALLMSEAFENVYTAEGGEEALEILGAERGIGLVLLDIMMPGMDGYEVCRRMQEHDDWREIPVIMVTGGGLTQNQALKKSFQVGATDYVSKPINEVELFARMGMALALYQERLYRHAQSSLLASREEQFRLTFDLAPVGIAQLELDGRTIQTNQSMRTLLGCASNDQVGGSLIDCLAPGQEFPSWQEIRAELERGDTGQVEREARFVATSGALIWANVRVTLMNVAEEGVAQDAHFIVSLEDVTERKRAHHEMERIAFHDPLTGLANRRLYNRQLSESIDVAEQAGDELAVYFLDLDHFKQVNDTLGHAVGDRLLQQASVRIGECLSREDVLARLGGDEFAMLLRKNVSVEHCVSVAQSIVEAFTVPLPVEGHEIIVTPSIGISLYPRDGSSADALMKNADAAMYRAKEAGRNGFRIYDSSMSFQVAERMSLEQDLRRAKERGELRLFIQPQCEIADGSLVGAEALMRWQHPEEGLLPPERFIPLAEDTGLIVSLGEWVLRETCEQISRWLQEGRPVVPVMVNLSMIQMRSDDVLNVIDRVLQDTAIPPSLLGIELTENIASHNSDEVIELLKKLNQRGLRIVMDDFGSGYSSLSRLKRFPIDSVKIDKSFIADIPDDADDVAIVKAIIALAKTLGLLVVAEGVENESQLELLREFQCDIAQGFLFGRAVPVEEFQL